MKNHIDALFEALEKNIDRCQHITNFWDLYGILYEIGSQWEHYKELFE